MIVYAIYVVSESGITLVSEHFHAIDEFPDEILLGGLITALQQMAIDIHHSEMKTMEIEGLSYHIRSFGLFRIVLVTDGPQSPEHLIQTLGLRFMKEYGELLLDKIVFTQRFLPFKKTIHELIQLGMVTDDSKSIQPTKKLRTGEIFNLPHYLQATALAMVFLQEGTVEEIAEESGITPDVTRQNLTVLNERGFIGIKQKNDKTFYFCSL